MEISILGILHEDVERVLVHKGSQISMRNKRGVIPNNVRVIDFLKQLYFQNSIVWVVVLHASESDLFEYVVVGRARV